MSGRITRALGRSRGLAPGLAAASLVAAAAQFLSAHYGAPAMLMALLIGIALNFLSDEPGFAGGIGFASRTILRLGVALLGLRIGIGVAVDLGAPLLALVVTGVLLTIGFGLAMGRLVGFGPRFSFLSAGAVAICGASAAMAIAAILPRDERSDERLIFTVVGVTVLSTLAMIVYPILLVPLGLEGPAAGVFLGATIHDVAQVVGAGFSVGPQTGETATLVKLIRVAMLAPVVLTASLVVRRVSGGSETARPPILPAFVAGFLALAALNSTVALPAAITDAAAWVSRAALLAAVAAVGMKTRLREVLGVGGRAIGLLVAETAFLAIFVASVLALQS